LVFEALIGHVLEFLKIVLQTSSQSDSDETTYWRAIQDITAAKGVAGLWDGFVPWGLIQSLSKGAVFGLAHAWSLSLLLPLAKDRKVIPMALALTLAGGIGGGFQGYVLSPTLLLKTRVMTVRSLLAMFRLTCWTVGNVHPSSHALLESNLSRENVHAAHHNT
jgi:Mitochondrial carrier protein